MLLYLKHFTPLYWMKSLLYSRRFQGPNGHYYYNSVPFGIASGPEENQWQQHEFLDSLRGVINITDDICVYGCGDTKENANIDHDQNMVQLLEKCAEHNLRLCKKTSVQIPTFMVHKLTHKGVEPRSYQSYRHQRNASSNRQSCNAMLRRNVPIPDQIMSA